MARSGASGIRWHLDTRIQRTGYERAFARLLMHAERTPSRTFTRTTGWILAGIAFTVASISGVVIRAAGYPAAVPELATRTLTTFTEPGLGIWWFTLGAAFQSFPSGFAGYMVTVFGNVAFWLGAVKLAAGVASWVLLRLRN